MEKDRLVTIFCKPADGNIEPFEMVWKIIGIKRPEILLVGKDVHNLRLIRIFSERLKSRYNTFNGRTVADNINLGKNYAAAEIHKGIMA